MKIYIQSISAISPQNTFGDAPLNHFLEQKTVRLNAMEPDYKELIDPKQIRRMSRIIKMGVAAANKCLKKAEVQMPDAIIVGTAYGCLEDTGVFLSKMTDQKEELLTPTAFIQSTHNTVAAQIALLLHCHHYNFTYVHRGFSFENALLDAMLFLKEEHATHVLTGAVDEITEISQSVLNRFGLYKTDNISNKELFLSKSKGTIAGEGASFFLLSNQNSEKNIARIDGLKTFYKPKDFETIEREIQSFLKTNSTHLNEIDLIITGRNGDIYNDDVYDKLEKSLFEKNKTINYKQLSGEYPSSSAFAFWLASFIIQSQKLPPALNVEQQNNQSFKKILIYNHFENIHHSLMLLSAC